MTHVCGNVTKGEVKEELGDLLALVSVQSRLSFVDVNGLDDLVMEVHLHNQQPALN